MNGTVGNSDDQAMSEACQEASLERLGELMQRWREPLHRLCWRMLGDEFRAEDLVQEAFARVFVHRQEFRPGSRFSTWVWRIALNLCYDELRKRTRRNEVALEMPAEDGERSGGEWRAEMPTPHEAVAGEERRREVRQALAALPAIYRSVVVLRHYENLKFAEIAEVLGIPEGTVKSRMAEGLGRMAKLLTQAGGAGGGGLGENEEGNR